MPQARLPDINAAFTKHRNEAIANLKSGRYTASLGSLYAWNALLPDILDDDGNPKYRIVISDIEYAKKAKPSTNLFCYNCDSDDSNPIEYDSVKMFDYYLPFESQIVVMKKYMKSWICPNCNKVNILDKTRRLDKIAETRLKEPFYLGVMPKPPLRRFYTTSDKVELERWIYSMIDELEATSAQFRDDNWTKDEQKEAEFNYEGGEEQE